MSSRIVTLVLSVTLYLLAVKNLNRVMTVSRALANALLHPGQTVHGVLADTVRMCSRVMIAVFAVTPYILTVSNYTESRPSPVHCLMHCRAVFCNGRDWIESGVAPDVLVRIVKVYGVGSYLQVHPLPSGWDS